MSIKSILLGSICAIALGASGPALAEGFSGTASADYANYHNTSGGGSADSWGATGEGAAMLGDSGASIQLDGGYHKLDLQNSTDVNVWDADGSLFATLKKGGRIGATFGYSSTDGDGGSAHYRNVGLFGEWWASDMLTLGGKLGSFDGKVIGSGYYAGIMGKYYVMPDFGLNAAMDQTHFGSMGNETDYTLSGEYLLSETMPVSVVGGYTYANIGGEHIDTWFLSLKFYCNGDSGATTLVDRQRSSGTLGWDAGMTSFGARF